MYQDEPCGNGRYPTTRTEVTEQLSVADRLDASRFFGVPETAGEVARQVMRRLDAGAALVYALHDAGPGLVAGLPEPVRQAYARCCAVYRPDDC